MNRLHTRTVILPVANSYPLLPISVVGGVVSIPDTPLNTLSFTTSSGGMRIVNAVLVSNCPPCVSNPNSRTAPVVEAFQVDLYDTDPAHRVNNYTIHFPALNVMVSCDEPIYSSVSAGIVSGSITAVAKGGGIAIGTATDGNYTMYLHLTVELSQ